jgi:ABC-2 type transport system ATP-binding protein
MNNPIIKVKNLSRQFEYSYKNPGLKNSIKNLFKSEKLFKDAVKDISFEIQEGEFVGFVGPNGAGKTTTLKMLSGILTPSSGEVNVLGYVPEKRQSEYKKQFALVMGQKNQLWWDLPAMESFILNQKIYEIEKGEFEKRLQELVELLDVGDNIYKQVRKLSLGERMKCELIAALLHNPKVLFLDEPTIGLDVVAQKNIRDFLKKYNKEKKITIILTSHYMDDIAELCKRIVIINSGKIIYDGQMSSLVEKYAPHKTITVFFETDVDEKDLASFGDVHEFKKLKATLKVPRSAVKEKAIQILSSDLPVKDIDIGEENIDSIIRNIFIS